MNASGVLLLSSMAVLGISVVLLVPLSNSIELRLSGLFNAGHMVLLRRGGFKI